MSTGRCCPLASIYEAMGIRIEYCIVVPPEMNGRNGKLFIRLTGHTDNEVDPRQLPNSGMASMILLAIYDALGVNCSRSNGGGYGKNQSIWKHQ